MSDPYSFGNGTPSAPNAPAPSGKEASGLADRWRNWMSSPGNRAALIQFGVSLAQPVGPGQNVAGQIGSALGQAGEASTRVDEQARRQQETESKAGLREAQATAAEARAGAAGARAGAVGERAELARERLAMQQRLGGMRTNAQLLTAYYRDVAKMRQQNELSGEPQPVPSFEEWIAANPRLADTLGAAPQGAAEATPSAPIGAPRVGEIRKGYKFKGGDPASPSSWEKASP